MSDEARGYDELGKGQALVEQALRAREPAQALAGALKQIWPDARLCCSSLSDTDRRAHLLDEGGCSKPEWLSPLERAVQRWRASHPDARTGSCQTPRAIPFRGDIQLAWLQQREEFLGYLAVAFPISHGCEPVSWAPALLARLADHLTLLLRLERASRRSGWPPPEKAHILADLVGPLCHELHNVFNAVALQAAILAREVPEELRAKVAVFRTQAFRGSEILSPVDRFRHLPHSEPAEIQVNEAVEQALAWCRDQGITPPDCQLTADLPPIRADRMVLARVVWLLLRNAHAASGTSRAARVTVRTAPAHDAVVLTVRDNGPGVPRDRIENFFELTSLPRGGEEPLERVACQGLVRHLGGVLSVVSLPRKGVEVSVELPLRA